MDKKLFFVIGSITVVLLLAAAWGYLLFFGSPGMPGTFTNLDLVDGTEEVVLPIDTEPAEEPVVNLDERPALRQLTTRPVAGFREVQTSTSSPRFLYYVEMGTGHLYRINLATGQEERRSGTTLAMATEAAISPNGDAVVLRSGQGTRAQVHVGRFSSSSPDALEFSLLPNNWLSYTFTADGELLLAQQTDFSVIAQARDVVTNTSQTLFTVPFREAVIVWGAGADATHYVYPKPSRHLEGALFAATTRGLERLPIDGFGLTALASPQGILFNRYEAGEYVSYTLGESESEPVLSPIILLPEKCVLETGSIAFCAGDFIDSTADLPDNWYMGLFQTSDAVWEISLNLGGANQLVNPQQLVGRSINITDMTVSTLTSELHFINKTDNTLWLYEIPN